MSVNRLSAALIHDARRAIISVLGKYVSEDQKEELLSSAPFDTMLFSERVLSEILGEVKEDRTEGFQDNVAKMVSICARGRGASSSSFSYRSGSYQRGRASKSGFRNMRGSSYNRGFRGGFPRNNNSGYNSGYNSAKNFGSNSGRSSRSPGRSGSAGRGRATNRSRSRSPVGGAGYNYGKDGQSFQ